MATCTACGGLGGKATVGGWMQCRTCKGKGSVPFRLVRVIQSGLRAGRIWRRAS